jgi:flagellar hook assembly protein FlgD
VARLALSAPAPNPAREESRLTLAMPAAGHVDAAVFDVLGRRVRTLASGAREGGAHELRWDGRDESGRRAAPGAYFVRAVARGEIASRRIARL